MIDLYVLGVETRHNAINYIITYVLIY